ncbi:MAG: sugar ABC transporter permease [Actinomycetota bacterium]|nr:sugar ABC transporter permease [Actinomycetota bacterium]
MRGATRLAWPYLAGLLVLVALPLCGSVALAFTEYSGISAPEFNGLDNISRLFGDASFWRSFGNSIVYAAIAVPVRLVVAVGLALLLHKRALGATAGRVGAYMPSVIPDVAYALLWLWLLNPLYGPLAVALRGAGLPDVLTDPWSARVAMALMGAFQVGEAFIVALAARRAVSERLYEVAAVDGASAWFTLRRLTLPVMAPLIGLLALRDVILSFQINFVPALLVTEGGPRLATTYLPLYAYRQAFRYFRLGYASAMSLTMFLFTGLIVYVQYRLIRKWRLR